MITTIFLDMDGVVTDWVGVCCNLFDMDKEEAMSNWKEGHFAIEDVLGVSSEKLWECVDAAGKDYWANLPEIIDAKRLYLKCCSLAPTCFLSSPSNHPQSLAGKLEWLQKFTGESEFKNYIFTSHKHLCARKDTVLIDDSDDKIDAFRLAGGKGILYPQKWNRMYNYVGNSCDYVISKLEKFCSEQIINAPVHF